MPFGPVMIRAVPRRGAKNPPVPQHLLPAFFGFDHAPLHHPANTLRRDQTRISPFPERKASMQPAKNTVRDLPAKCGRQTLPRCRRKAYTGPALRMLPPDNDPAVRYRKPFGFSAWHWREAPARLMAPAVGICLLPFVWLLCPNAVHIFSEGLSAADLFLARCFVSLFFDGSKPTRQKEKQLELT